MRSLRLAFAALVVVGVASSQARAAGLLIPEDVKLPPLAMVNHRVTVDIVDQVAITTLEQTFRNHTDRALEATYMFPVPKGATVDKFTMWVDGKEQGGELLDAKHASKVYTDIVRRTQDPGILEYLGNSMMRMKIFPVPPKGDQKVKISYKAIAGKDGKLVEYVYPLKTDGKGTRTLEEFAVKINIKSQHAIHNVYSPTHSITTTRKGDREVAIDFERNQAMLDKDFQLFYGFGDKDIGLTPLMYKPIANEDGYFMFLVTPQVEMSKQRSAARSRARARHVEQHVRDQDGAGEEGAQVLPRRTQGGRSVRDHQVLHDRIALPRQARARRQGLPRSGKQVGRWAQDLGRHRDLAGAR